MLPKLQINNQPIKRVDSVRFLDVSQDVCLSWNRHSKYIENKVSTNIDLLYKAKLFVDQSPYFHHIIRRIHVFFNKYFYNASKTQRP